MHRLARYARRCQPATGPSPVLPPCLNPEAHVTPINRLSVLLWPIVLACLAVGPLLVAPVGCAPQPTATPTPWLAPSPVAITSPTHTPLPTATAAPTSTPSPTPVPVHVLRTYPIDGDSDALPAAPLRIVFDQAMDPDPAALGLTLAPELPIEVEWPAPDTLLVHTGPRQPGIEYRLSLERARGQTGGELSQPLALTFGQGGRGAPIPILMYHRVEPLPADAPGWLKDWAVSPDAFVAQLDLLAGLDAHIVPLADVVDYLSTGAPLPARPAVITFDDGNACIMEHAVPVLEERGLPVIFFIPANYADVNIPDYTNWEQVNALAEAGFSLGGHSYNHAYVHELSPAEAERQIGEEKARIEAMTGTRVEFFAYPFGLYSHTTIEQLKQYGYRAALTIEQTVYQKPGNLFELGRIRLGYDDPPERLLRLLPWQE